MNKIMKNNLALEIVAVLVLLILPVLVKAQTPPPADPLGCTVNVHIDSTDGEEHFIGNPDPEKCATGDIERHAPAAVGMFCPTGGSDAWCLASKIDPKTKEKVCTGQVIPMSGAGIGSAIASNVVLDGSGKFTKYSYRVADGSPADNIGANDFTVIFPTKIAVAAETKGKGFKTFLKNVGKGVGTAVIGSNGVEAISADIKKRSSKSISNCAELKAATDAASKPKTASATTGGGYYNPQSIEVRYKGWALAADQTIVKIGQNSYFTTVADDRVNLGGVSTILGNYNITQLNMTFCSPKASDPIISRLNPDSFCSSLFVGAGQ